MIKVQREDKYEGCGTRNFKKALLTVAALIITAAGILMFGCDSSEISETPSQTIEVVVTPTATASPTPTPSATPVPLTVEEKVAKFGISELYGNKSIPLNQIGYLDYNVDGVNKMTFFYLYGIQNETDGSVDVFFSNFLDATALFSMDEEKMNTYGYDKKGFPYYNPVAEGYSDEEVELLNIGPLSDFEKVLASKGIVVPKTEFSEKINDPSSNGAMSATQIAKYLATVLPDSMCVFHEQLVKQEGYPPTTK